MGKMERKRKERKTRRKWYRWKGVRRTAVIVMRAASEEGVDEPEQEEESEGSGRKW